MDANLRYLVDSIRDAMQVPCRACGELRGSRVLCPDGYCADCCGAADHNHPEHAVSSAKR